MNHNPYIIKSYIENEWREPGSLCQAIGIFKDNNKNTYKTISVVGAGGKTTVIRRILKECKKMGIPCAVSTTTHIQAWDVKYFLGEPSMERFRRLMLEYGSVWMGKKITEDKLTSFSDTFIRKIIEEPGILLLEADGAKHLPVKAPAMHEPVIIPETDVVLNVYGMSAVGKKICEVCCRKEIVMEILGKRETDLLCPEDIMILAKSSLAGKKKVEGSMEYHVILNQADTREQIEMAEKIAEGIHGIAGIHITAGLLPLEDQW